MSRKNSEISLIASLCMVLCYISIASIVVGSNGASYYAKEKHNESIYKPTMCFVQNYSSFESQCSTQNCYFSGFSQSCTTSCSTCYIDTYVVIYNVSDGTQIESTTIGKDGPGTKSINGTYQCYYSSTNETSVRWTWFNSNKYLIMLCVGWSVFGLSIIRSISCIRFVCCPNKF